MLHSSHTRTSRLRTTVLIACTPQPDHMNSFPVLKPTSLAPANLTQPQPAPPMPCPAPHTPPSHEPANRLGTRRNVSKTFRSRADMSIACTARTATIHRPCCDTTSPPYIRHTPLQLLKWSLNNSPRARRNKYCFRPSTTILTTCTAHPTTQPRENPMR
jgi:hypothetical protein